MSCCYCCTVLSLSHKLLMLLRSAVAEAGSLKRKLLTNVDCLRCPCGNRPAGVSQRLLLSKKLPLWMVQVALMRCCNANAAAACW